MVMIMDEYIKKNQALCCFSGWIDQNGDFHEPDEMIEYQRIEQLTAADVVPVVMCKDCKYYERSMGYCERLGITINDEDYCSFGERKGGDQ